MNRIISGDQIREIVPYSKTHLARLERAGEFPQRIRIGRNRVGWLASEIDTWIAERAEARTTLGP